MPKDANQCLNYKRNNLRKQLSFQLLYMTTILQSDQGVKICLHRPPVKDPLSYHVSLAVSALELAIKINYKSKEMQTSTVTCFTYNQEPNAIKDLQLTSSFLSCALALMSMVEVLLAAPPTSERLPSIERTAYCTIKNCSKKSYRK